MAIPANTPFHNLCKPGCACPDCLEVHDAEADCLEPAPLSHWEWLNENGPDWYRKREG